MPRGVRLVALALPAALSVAAACAPARSLGPSFLQGEGGADVETLRALAIPADAMVVLRLKSFDGRLSGDAGRDVRFQVVVRARHRDGGTVTWPVVGGRRLCLPLPNGRHHLSLESAEAVRFHARDLEAIEVLVATVAGSGERGDLLSGALAVAAAPPADTSDPARLEALEAAARAAGGTLELALAVPVETAPSPGLGTVLREVVLVERARDGAGEAGRLTLTLELEVRDHRVRPPDRPRDDPAPKDEDDWRTAPERDVATPLRDTAVPGLL